MNSEQTTSQSETWVQQHVQSDDVCVSVCLCVWSNCWQSEKVMMSVCRSVCLSVWSDCWQSAATTQWATSSTGWGPAAGSQGCQWQLADDEAVPASTSTARLSRDIFLIDYRACAARNRKFDQIWPNLEFWGSHTNHIHGSACDSKPTVLIGASMHVAPEGQKHNNWTFCHCAI